VEIDHQKVALDIQKVAMDKQNVKLVQLTKQKAVKQQGKRQDDIIDETRKLCRSEIKKYLTSHNNTESLKKLIVSEIEKYLSTAEQTLIKIVNGEAKSDQTHKGPNSANENDAFRIGRNVFCTGWDGSTWNRPFPHLVWLEFPSYHIPSKFSFKRASADQSPKTWKFVGSGDEGCDQNSNWVDLCGDQTGQNVVANEVVGCNVPIRNRERYRCLGFRIESATNAHTHDVCFQGIKLWEVKQPSLV